MSTQAEKFIRHLLGVDPRNSYDASSQRARVYMQPETDASALFLLDPRAVSAYLKKLETDAGSLWPEAPMDLRTYRLLSIHLMESVRDDPDEVFEVTPAGVTSPRHRE